MSLSAHKWVISLQLPPTRKFVLLMLADHADESGHCFPSIATLCTETGHYRETVTDAIKDLEAQGLIEVSRVKGQGSHYQLKLNATIDHAAKADQSAKADHAAKAANPTRQKPRTTTRQKPPLTYQGNLPRTYQECVSPADTPEQPANDPPAPTPKPRKRPLPADFAISDGVRRWAEAKGYADLDAHFESFCLKCQAKGYQYIDWDAALKTAIRDDWAGLRRPQSHRNPPGGPRHESIQRPMSAFDRVRQSGIEYLRRHGEDNIIDITEYRTEKPANGEPVGEVDGDLWPSMDIAIR